MARSGGDTFRSECASLVGQSIELHTLTYGKLMQGSDPHGAITSKAEHRFTSQSKGFPQDLMDQCTLRNIVPFWVGVMDSVLKPWQRDGALVIRKFLSDGAPYYVLAKISAWAENGKENKSRRFTHMNCWCVSATDIGAFELPFLVDLLFHPDPGSDFEPWAVPAVSDDVNRSEAPMVKVNYDRGNAQSLYRKWCSTKTDFKRGQGDQRFLAGSVSDASSGEGFGQPALALSLALLTIAGRKRTNSFSLELSAGIASATDEANNPFVCQYFAEDRETSFRSDAFEN